MFDVAGIERDKYNEAKTWAKYNIFIGSSGCATNFDYVLKNVIKRFKLKQELAFNAVMEAVEAIQQEMTP